MNWLAFALLAYLCLGLELGLREALRYGQTQVAPSLVIPLMVYVSLAARPRVAAWAAMALGLLLDLTWVAPLRGGGGVAHTIGPYTVGLLLAAQLTIAVRGFVIRRVFITTAVLSAVAAMVAHVYIVAAVFLRQLFWDDPIAFDATDQIRARLLSAMWTGLSGAVLGLAFNRVEPLLGFEAERKHRFRR